ncbi:hypothetical protein Pcinc_006025 [Petrolisthes cinctipes]|uniref:Uncharacterized protein n=1 Tax=Petrolisthes cinctipes TaxID=88211 RepID=A0AAE1GI71_PETCI|nr:hypothetical protein Pcinc_006025 [Petrolisthes cinctipes]
MNSAFTHKGEKILKWMKEQPSKNFRKIQEQLVEAKCSMSNGTPEAVAITCAVMSYFSEKEETVYKCVEAAATKADIEKNLPDTPCLIGFGESRMLASRFMLSIDGVVVNDHISTFTAGLVMLFCSYYNFNIMYPLDCAATLEFIQRCFVGINPDRGSKVQVKKNCKRYSQTHPKVLSLISAIADVDWRS